MVNLHGSLGSPFVARVLMQAQVKGIEVTLVPPTDAIPSFKRLNPIGKMPVLEHDGFVLPESAVIMEYLEEAFPAIPTLGGDAKARARARLVARTVDLYCTGTFDLLRAANDPTSSIDATAVRAGLYHGLDAVEAFIDGDGWAIGGQLSVADFTLVSWLFYGRMLLGAGHDFTADRPKLGRYLAFISGQPMVTALWEKMDVAFRAFMAKRAAEAAKAKG